MATVTPTALIAAIKGKWRGSCFQMWKGRIIIRRNPSPKPRNKASRAAYKGTISTLSACHYRLTANQQDAWNAYALLLPTAMSGYNAFMARNCALKLANHPTLCIYFNAPATYNPPTSPAPIGLCYYASLNSYCLFWTSPNCSQIFVQGYFSVQTGYSNKYSPSWRHHQTVVSTLLKMDFDASQFPTDTMIRFTARSINKNGEPSIQAIAVPPPPMPPDLYLTSPNGSESWYIASYHYIYWNAVSIDNIKIDYSINNGADWTEITPSISGSLGKYQWKIPALPSAQCLVKVSDASDPTNYDTSDSVFRIMTTPTLSLTSPNGSEEWEVGSAHNITWNSSNVTEVWIRYSYNNGDSWNNIATEYPAAGGSYEWTIPDQESTQCLVKIICEEDSSIYDTSDANFSIVPSTVPENCVAWWLLKTAGYDAGNSRFTDQTGNAHHCANNNISIGDDYSSFNGSDSYGRITDFTEIGASGTKLSVAIWVNGPTQDYNFFFSHTDYYTNLCWELEAETGNKFKLWLNKTLGIGDSKRYMCNLSSFDNTWHLLGFTWDSGTLKLFRDGVEVAGADLTKEQDREFNSVQNPACDIMIGCLLTSGNPDHHCVCKISKAYLFNDIITSGNWTTLLNLGY